MTIEEDYRTRLLANAALAGIVGDRIYPGEIPDHDAPAPWLYYSAVQSSPIHTLDTPSMQAVHIIEVNVLAVTYAQWKQLEALVIGTLDTVETFGQITFSEWTESAHDITEGGHHGTIRFTCHGPTNRV